MRKTPTGRGSVRKVKRGKHKGKYRVAVPVEWAISRNGKESLLRKTGIFKTKSDADAHRDKLLARRDAGASAPTSRRTLSEQLWIWHETVVAPELAENTVASYRHSITKHIAPHIGSRTLSEVSVPVVEEWLRSLDEAGIGARTRQLAYVVLRLALEHAVRRRDLAVNPCRAIKRPRAKRGKVDPFTREDANWILADSFEGPYAALFRLLLSTGLRQGEAFGLRPRDVDPFGKTVTVTQQVVESEGRVVVQAYPKTNASNRTVRLTEAAVALIFEHRKRMMRKGFAGREFEFVAPEGGVIRRSTFGSRVWRPMLVRLELRHRGAHHLRHTFATLMLGAGVPPHIVAKMLGHSSATVTLETYAHAIPDQIEEASAAQRRLFG